MNKNADEFALTQVLNVELESLEMYKNYYTYISDIVKENGRESIKKYIRDFNIRKVIIYGAGVAARILCDVLEKDELCEIVGVVDRSMSTIYGFHEFLSLEELSNTEYDKIIITPLGALTAIKADLDSMGIQKYCFISEMSDYDEGRKMLYENDIYSV